jgi:hypothetical protein
VKKILISISIFLGIVLLIGVLGYLLRNPVWQDMYADGEGNYDVVFEDFFPNKDLEYNQVVDIYRMTYRKGYLHLFPTGTNMVVMLDQNKGEVIDIDLPSITTNTEIDLMVNFESEKKSVIDEIRCSYLKDNSCMRDLVLRDWTIKSANLEE